MSDQAEPIGAEGVVRYLSDRFEWAAPGDQQEDAWLVRFCDKDCGDAIFTGPEAEREAWKYWNRYAPSFNLYVFRLAALRTPDPKAAGVERGRDPMLGMVAALAAAISLLEKGGKKAAPSDRMFEQMLTDYRKALENGRAALRAVDVAPGGGVPIPMILHCPRCHVQHVDEPDERTPEWDNPSHRSHLCHSCGCIWRPADVATEGVRDITTIGKADNWTPATPTAAPALNVQALVEALEPFKREWEDMGIPETLSDDMLMLDADGVGGEILTVGHWRALIAAIKAPAGEGVA